MIFMEKGLTVVQMERFNDDFFASFAKPLRPLRLNGKWIVLIGPDGVGNLLANV